ncbi:MAG: hypothetical protein AAB557_01960 [Patescibacteria group bacterium]
MKILPSLGFVLGPADDFHWGQVLSSPVAYGVVEIEDPDGRARDWGVKVLARLSEQTADPPKSLKAAQEIAIHAMEEPVTSLILLVPVGAVLYVVLLGEGRVSLKRGSSLATLMDKPGAISGQVEEGDTLILMTKSVARTLSHEETNALFGDGDAADVAEKMTLAIHEHPSEEGGSSLGGAALIVRVKGLVPVEKEAPPSRIVRLSRVRRIATYMLHPRRLKDRLKNVPIPWQRPMVPITAILVLLFLLSVVLGIVKQMGQKVETHVAEVLAQSQHAFDEGVALLELNPVKGRERLSDAKTLLSPLREGLAPSSIEGKAVAKLYKDVVDQLTIAMQVYRGEPSLFYDLTLLKASASISSFGSDGDALALLDTRGPTAAVVAIQSKNGRIIGGGESYRGASLLAVHGDTIFVLVDGGLHRVSASDGKTTPLVVRGDTQWGTIASVVSYGGNLYLLDTGKSRIWKYVATEKGFSEIREYLNPDTLPDLSQGTGMAADGGIWVGTGDRRIIHFVQGKEETFAPRGVEPSLGKTLVVATTEEDKLLYVLDSDNKRVVVLDKEGVYQAQYVWAGSMVPNQLFVSEKLKRILLLADGKIYSVELK